MSGNHTIRRERKICATWTFFPSFSAWMFSGCHPQTSSELSSAPIIESAGLSAMVMSTT